MLKISFLSHNGGPPPATHLGFDLFNVPSAPLKLIYVQELVMSCFSPLLEGTVARLGI